MRKGKETESQIDKIFKKIALNYGIVFLCRVPGARQPGRPRSNLRSLLSGAMHGKLRIEEIISQKITKEMNLSVPLRLKSNCDSH